MTVPHFTINGITRPVRAVIFDKDGTLIDFGSLWSAVAHSRIANIVGGVGTRDTGKLQSLLLAATGLGPAGNVDPFGPLATASRSEELTMAAGTLYVHCGIPYVEARELCRQAFAAVNETELLETYTRPLPGVPAILQYLRQAGLQLGIASTDTTANIMRGNQLLDIEDLIAVSLGADRVPSGKPNPDMLILAAELLNIPVAEMIMVGDGVVDMQMGRNAGVAFTVGVLTGVARAEQLQPFADILLPSLSEWPRDRLLQAN